MTDDIEQCLKVLREGGVILYPTDTIWGLGCDATNEQAVQSLIDIKGKPDGKGLIVIVPSERYVLQYAASPDLAVFDFLSTTAKPTTVIYEHGLGVADNVLNEDGSIAIRLVQDEFCKQLLNRFKKPLVSTSANLHGQPSPQKFGDISPELKGRVDYVVHHRREDTSPAAASALVKWVDGEAVYLRK